MAKAQTFRKRIVKNLGNVGMALVTASLMCLSASAVDASEAASQVINNESGKEAINAALKMAKSKP